MNTPLKYILYTGILLLFIRCNNAPKVIQPTSSNSQTEGNESLFTPDPSIMVSETKETSFSEDLHRVRVLEVLPAQRYVYLRVEEGENIFWIASRKIAVEKEEIYFYRNGLLKTNFESKEYNKIFDEIYLVSNLVAEDHSKHSSPISQTTVNKENPVKEVKKENIPTHTEKNVQHKGSLTIAELVKDPAKYEGHTIQISGTCVKINPNIMERNWIHIQDGTKDDFDLVVTSDIFVPEGSKITIKATVALNRDFGAGYTYDLILENGVVIQ